jgi:hypothetical protein
MTLGWIGATGGVSSGTPGIPRARPVWIDLDVAFPLPRDHPHRVIAGGLELSGRVPGMLKRWIRGSQGEWLGLVYVQLRDGAGDVRLTLDDQLVPAAALRPRQPPGPAHQRGRSAHS